jgi:hypothetical protein
MMLASDSENRFIVFGSQRSGTTSILDFLSEHPDVVTIKSEVYTGTFFNNGLNVFLLDQRKITKEQNILNYQRLFSLICSGQEVCLGDNKGKLVGFKCNVIGKFDAEKFLDVLKNCFPEIKIIYCKRNDYVAKLGSLILARNRDIWHVRKDGLGKRPCSAKIFIKEKNFINYAAHNLIVDRQLAI